MTRPFRPGPPPPRPVPPVRASVADDPDGDAGHPAVDAAVQSVVNAAALSPADQIPAYEAAYETLRETLATIDQA